jgi:hypothetical protein
VTTLEGYSTTDTDTDAYVIATGWPTKQRNIVLLDVLVTVSLGWALGEGTGNPLAGLGAGVAAALVLGLLFHHTNIKGAGDRVRFAVDSDGIYLSAPPRRVPWPQVIEVGLYQAVGPHDEAATQRLAVRLASDTARPGSVPPDWTAKEVIDDLLLAEPLDVPPLRAAVTLRAPHVLVRDYGGISAR